ncbi:endonuclease/exonuclease/phosphatase family protein [Vibrio campbellii]|uniref:endonuclease/exonuclease/phosphatase family protein n=1 Tax=Vibrio campbellii TaxID=680 RepID=UPI0002AE0F3C|nr:endonuclease/exonuclease/phosphatase family protein [Vibrio campbellii]ARV71349.1 hypothetical protein A8140_00920 [Vibrio campbellii CAIM 519 = NBRC 15631 = ATCC 25920]ELU49429.1 endonuclease/exonuclease/phosphatase [Vibrio campbellii CAIM 519 = NBRC 15631 = ATCC 25920]
MNNYSLDLTNKIDNDYTTKSSLKILSWNLQSPSLSRFKEQVDYICSSKANILVLTELKSKNIEQYASLLEMNNYNVHHGMNLECKYTTIIATRNLKSNKCKLYDKSDDNPRSIIVNIYFSLGMVTIWGTYMPSYHPLYATPERISLKKSFSDNELFRLRKYFSGPSNRLIFTGDLNILEPEHIPRIDGYKQWNYVYSDLCGLGLIDCYTVLRAGKKNEHSWVSQEGEGQRLDHMFVDTRMDKSIRSCYFDHLPRLNKLSDHSAMYLDIF